MIDFKDMVKSKKNHHFLYKQQQVIRSLPVEFVFLTLPYRKVEGIVYKKESETATLTITSGYSVEDKDHYGIPYGIYPRLILYFICSEARRTRSKEIHLGKNVQDILERLSITDKGVRNDGKVLKSFKEQLLKLTNAVIAVTSTKNMLKGDDVKIKKSSIKIVREIEFWKKSTQVDYKLILTDDFFNYLMNSSITVFDTKILQAIKSSPTTLDLYVLLNYKAYIANKFDKDLYVSFKELHSYFGTQNEFKSFKQNIKKNLLSILNVYPELNLNIEDNGNRKGIIIRKDSMSSVQPDLFASNYE